jgi:hypothetical protein
MKTCRRIQEKLVAAESLQANEQEHLGRCRECREIQQLNDLLREDGRSEPLLLASPGPRPVRALWPVAAGALAALVVLAVLLFWPRAVDYGQTAEKLAVLWDEVDQATEVADSGLGSQELSGWLALEMENFDPAAADNYWP